MDNREIARVLAETATLLELKGENPFKSRAYLNAVRTIEASIRSLPGSSAMGSSWRSTGSGGDWLRVR
jgi:DNA polymerase/3'-5' exonuclease PolX